MSNLLAVVSCEETEVEPKLFRLRNAVACCLLSTVRTSGHFQARRAPSPPAWWQVPAIETSNKTHPGHLMNEVDAWLLLWLLL